MILHDSDLANALEHAGGALLLTDTNGVIVHVNHQVCVITGYSAHELLGKSPSILQSARTDRIVYNDMWKTINSGHTWTGRLLNKRKPTHPSQASDGNPCQEKNEYWAQLTITPIRNSDGEVYLYAGVHQDLTRQIEIEEFFDFERKGAQVRARIASVLQSTKPLNDRLDESLEILTGLDELHIENKCGILIANQDQTDLNLSVIHGELTQELMGKEQRIPFDNSLCERAAESGETIISDNCFCKDHHENTNVGMTAHGHYIVPLQIKSRNIGIMFLYTQPYPDRNQSQIDMLQDVGHLIAQAIRNDQIEQRLILASKAAEDSSMAKSDFLANMSHEIRTPLNGILGFTDMLLRDDDRTTDENRKEWLGVIQTSGQHLLQLINNILDLSKVESGELDLEITECNPIELLADLASIMRIHANDKMIKLNVKTSGLMPHTIKTDTTRLRQILTNLVGNAIKFTEKGSVTMRIHLHDTGAGQQELVIEIIDTGMGIPDEKLLSIFAPFSQADSSITRNFGGTGLGLTISRNLAEALGGTLRVASLLGKGSTFTLSLPVGSIDDLELHDNFQSESIRSKHSSSPKPSVENRLNGKVLLVDDGQTNRQLIALILKRAGAEVTTANDGQEGFELASASDFDLILMDMQMPVMDGYTASTCLRKHGITTPIIALTASAMTGDRERCLKAGCNDYLTKPVDIEELVDRSAHWMAHEIDSADGPIDTVHASTDSPALISTLPMDDPDLREIVLGYIDTLPKQLAEIENAYANKDYAQLASSTHKLIGSGGTVGLDPLSDLASLIEESLHANEFEKMAQSIAELRELTAQIERGARELPPLESELLG
ncbi:MAG: response regulator [Phycisphaerales bacterium]|nr:response regulator [Phycisphaerales bacterium]